MRVPYPSDAEWTILAPLLPPSAACGRPRKWPARLIADAVFYVLRSGCARRMVSAAAMGRYVRYQLAEGDSALRLTHAPTWRTLDGALGVGPPWIVGRADALGRRLRYSGGTFGFASFVDLYPDARVGVALLTNGADDATQDALQHLAERIARVAATPTAAVAGGC